MIGNFLFIIGLFLSAYGRADDWICKEASAQRQGSSTFLACGVGEGMEADARSEARENAAQEFRALCSQDSSCFGRETVITPLRTTCERINESKVRCFRGFRYSMGAKLPEKKENIIEGTDEPTVAKKEAMQAADQGRSQSTASSKPIASTAVLELIHVFPEAVVEKMVSTLKTQKDSKLALRQIRSMICDGEKLRVPTPSYRVTVVMPKAPRGTPLIEADKTKKKFIELARVYLKRWFFSQLADFDFESVKAISVIPVTRHSDLPSIITDFSDLRYSPTFPPMETHPLHEWFPEMYLAILLNNSERAAVLVPKFMPLVKEGIVKEYVLGDLQFRDVETEHSLAHQADFSVTAQKVNTTTGTTYQLRRSYAEDLALLREYFVIAEATKEGIEDRHLSFDRALARWSTVKEATPKEGAAEFTVELGGFSEFCSKAKAITEVVSE